MQTRNAMIEDMFVGEGIAHNTKIPIPLAHSDGVHQRSDQLFIILIELCLQCNCA